MPNSISGTRIENNPLVVAGVPPVWRITLRVLQRNLWVDFLRHGSGVRWRGGGITLNRKEKAAYDKPSRPLQESDKLKLPDKRADREKNENSGFSRIDRNE